jgi:hypothetical protein
MNKNIKLILNDPIEGDRLVYKRTKDWSILTDQYNYHYFIIIEVETDEGITYSRYPAALFVNEPDRSSQVKNLSMAFTQAHQPFQIINGCNLSSAGTPWKKKPFESKGKFQPVQEDDFRNADRDLDDEKLPKGTVKGREFITLVKSNEDIMKDKIIGHATFLIKHKGKSIFVAHDLACKKYLK